MQKLSSIEISNFRSIENLKLDLGENTVLVGNNNVGKSNILNAIKWFLKPYALKESDFLNPQKRVEVVGTISGLDDSTLDMLDPVHKNRIEPLLVGSTMTFRKRYESPSESARSIRIEIQKKSGDELEWIMNPTGIKEAIQDLFPEPIFIEAMNDANEDICRNKSGTSISKLISQIIDPFVKRHSEQVEKTLDEIRQLTEASGERRDPELLKVDRGLSSKMKTLFPGIELRVHVPTPTLKEIFRHGTLKAIESSSLKEETEISQLGHGAQRMAQMSLIQFLADQETIDTASRTLLLIDEPELYLHPNAIELLSESLRVLGQKTYQIVFSTHSPQFIHKERIKNTILVRKCENGRTYRKDTLQESISRIVSDQPSQLDLLFDFENSKEVFFSNMVVFGEGRTEKLLVPEIWEHTFGISMGCAQIAFVGLNGCGSSKKCLDIVTCMGLEAVALVDLDFAFRMAVSQGIISEDNPHIVESKRIFKKLSCKHPIKLQSDGFPCKFEGHLNPEEAFALFASDCSSEPHIEGLKSMLLDNGFWLWSEGSIETHLGLESKKDKDRRKYIKQLRRGEIEIKNESAIDFLNYLNSNKPVQNTN